MDSHSTGGIHLNITKINHCTTMPPYVNSNDVLPFEERTLEATLPLLELQMFAVFLISHGFYHILKRFGIPVLVSQILAGVIIGTTGFGRQADYRRIFFTIDNKHILGALSGLGAQLYVFINGIKMDLTLLRKTGKMTIYSGVLSVIIPALLGGVTLSRVSAYWGLQKLDKLSLFLVMIVQSLTPFPVICSFIDDLKLTNSELGRLGLASSLASEIQTQFFALLAFFVAIAYKQTVTIALKNMGICAAFIIVVVYLVRPAMLWVIKRTPKGRPVKDIYADTIILGALCSGLVFKNLGLNVMVGSFFFGLAVPAGPPLASALVDKLESMVSGVLVPLLMAMCTMGADFSKINFDDYILKSTAVVVVVVMLAKFAAIMAPLLHFKLPKQDAIALSFLVSTKGVLDLGSYEYMREGGLLTEGMYAFLVIVILFLATISSITVKWLYDPSRKYGGYQKRNIMHSKDNMCLLTCIHRPDNITSIINFLTALCPTIENPVTVCALHLVKIKGRSSPLLISHQKQRTTASRRSISGNVVLSFDQFQRDNIDIVSVHIFTAISPPKFMHEDICTLALDETACFIVLPFHRKWLVDGSIESEDTTLRTLNCCVLERAPCSLGILIDHGNQVNSIFRDSSTSPSLSVALVFFGGNDDQEALALAARMSRHRKISLTIVCFILLPDDIKTDRASVLDSEVLKDNKPDGMEDQQVKYSEERVRDGLEILNVIQSMLSKYDLFIVGRRKDIETPQTAGLDMTDYPELGVIGSLLASMDTTERYSVLVVQQQVALPCS